MDLPFGMEVDGGVVVDAVISLKIWQCGVTSGMPGTDSLERVEVGLLGSKICVFAPISSCSRMIFSIRSAPARSPQWSEMYPSCALLMLAVVN